MPHFKPLSLRKALVLIFCIVLGLELLSLGLTYYGYKTPRSSLWIEQCMTKKESIARGIKGPKLLVIGGSNVLFGVSTQDIEQARYIPCVNMGISSELGLPYILERSKRTLKPKDIVICQVTLDFCQISKPTLPFQYIKTYDQGYFYQLPLQQKLALCLQASWIDLLNSAYQQLFFTAQESPSPAYNSGTLNTHGDETYHSLSQNSRLKLDGNKQPISIYLPFKETYGLQELVRFERWCRTHDINCFFSFSPYLQDPKALSKPQSQALTALKNYFIDHHLQILGSPEAFLYADPDLFYDTPSHLNDKGMILNTQKLIGYLQTALPSL